MNVLLVDHAPFFGGAESFLLDLLSALDRKQFSPSIVTDSNSPVVGRFRASGDPVLTMPLPRINGSPLFLYRLFRAGSLLARIARDTRTDVMHTFGVRTHLVGAIASRLCKVPLLWRICDDTFPPRLVHLFSRTPRVIVAASTWLTLKYPKVKFDGLAQDGARPPSPVSRIGARAQLGLSENDLIVAHVSRLVRWKGQAVFIQALSRAMPKVPGLVGLIVGGSSSDERGVGLLGGGTVYADELRAQASKVAPNRINFTGFLQNPDIVYAAADIFAHTSILPEPFGRTVIEAMMAGVPVIATNAGALPEIVTDGTGLLTAPGDADALARALVELGSSSEKRKTLGEAGRKRAELVFSLESMTRRMEGYYCLAAKAATLEHHR